MSLVPAKLTGNLKRISMFVLPVKRMQVNYCKYLTNIDCVLRDVVKDAEETVNHLNNVSSASALK
jgi:hypothetical protein